MKTKMCPKCGKRDLLCGFSKNRTKPDGLQSICKDCVKKANARTSKQNVDRVRKWRAENAEKYKLSQTEYYQKNKKALYAKHCDWRKRNPKAVSSETAKYRIKHPSKRAATCALNNAVRDGRITKPITCQVCGLTGIRIHGHHEDYSKPLDVLWVCPLCHSLIHQEKRNDGRTNQSTIGTINTESSAASNDRTEARNGHASL